MADQGNGLLFRLGILVVQRGEIGGDTEGVGCFGIGIDARHQRGVFVDGLHGFAVALGLDQVVDFAVEAFRDRVGRLAVIDADVACGALVGEQLAGNLAPQGAVCPDQLFATVEVGRGGDDFQQAADMGLRHALGRVGELLAEPVPGFALAEHFDAAALQADVLLQVAGDGTGAADGEGVVELHRTVDGGQTHDRDEELIRAGIRLDGFDGVRQDVERGAVVLVATVKRFPVGRELYI